MSELLFAVALRPKEDDMKFAVATKRMHLVVTYREPDEEEEDGILIQTSYGDLSPAPPPESQVYEDTHFGFVRG